MAKEAGIRAERSLQVRIERIGYRVVGLLVRAEYLPYGVSGLDGLLRGEPFEHDRMASPGRRMPRSRYRTGTFPSQSGLAKFQRRVASSGVSPNSALSQSLELHSTR